MKILYSIGVVFTVTFLLFSCYKDSEEAIYGSSGTSATNCADAAASVSYAIQIQPLFQQYCYSCHSANSPSGGVAMGSNATDKIIALNGKLYGCISYAAGYSPMPKGGSKFTNCQLATIKKWIDAGAPEN